MYQKHTDYTILLIGIVILIAVVMSSCTRSLPQPLLYNAYDIQSDEYYVISSDHPLDSNSLVYDNEHAQAVNYVTPYLVRIISPYKSN